MPATGAARRRCTDAGEKGGHSMPASPPAPPLPLRTGEASHLRRG
eukprot:gene18541-25606_t